VCERPVDVRIVAATHRDLAAAVAEGRFREDLHFRLDVLRIHVPPLRERVADIPLLARHFAADPPSPALLRELLAWRWPGNVRELAAALQRAALGSEGIAGSGGAPRGEPGRDRRSLDALLRTHRGDLGALARRLGVSVRTVQRRLARAGLRAADYRAAWAADAGPGAGPARAGASEPAPGPPEICIASDM
jgi:DNA-binding NtrC family response regulator